MISRCDGNTSCLPESLLVSRLQAESCNVRRADSRMQWHRLRHLLVDFGGGGKSREFAAVGRLLFEYPARRVRCMSGAPQLCSEARQLPKEPYFVRRSDKPKVQLTGEQICVPAAACCGTHHFGLPIWLFRPSER